MSKKTIQTDNKIFNIDVDALFTSEFLEEDDKDCNLSLPNLWTQSKKLKMDTSVKSANEFQTEETENVNPRKSSKKNKKNEDVFKFFESVGNDFTKSIQSKKNRLIQFTKKVSQIYQTKIGNLVAKHQEEFENFKTDISGNLKKELDKFRNEFEKLKQQEMKLTKLIEQQLKLLHKSLSIREEWEENMTEFHQNIIRDFEKLRSKQKTETLELSKSIEEEITVFQNDFLAEFKNEELQTIKKHFNSLYF